MSKVAIIGGGFAGTSCAYVLGKLGVECTIYEAGAELGAGASGNFFGLYSPRIAAHRTQESDYYAAGFAQIQRAIRDLDRAHHNPCGTLHLFDNERREKRFHSALKNWGWAHDHMYLVSAKEASDISGVDVPCAGVFQSNAGAASPKHLCQAYASKAKVALNASVKDIGDLEEEYIIMACGMGVTKFDETAHLELNAVRGQTTVVKATQATRALKCNIGFERYITHEHEGAHVVGATFQPWADNNVATDADDEENLSGLAKLFPALAEGMEVVGHRASVRTSTRNHFPLVGEMPNYKNLYVSVGYGSYGIIGSIASAHLIADMILKRPYSLSKDTVKALAPTRFHK